MESLEGLAQRMALEHVCQSFNDPFQLDHVPAMRADFERKLVELDAQLEAGQQAQLDEMQNASSLLDRAREEMRRVQSSLEAIYSNSKSCTKSFSQADFKHAVNVCNARININEVLEQLDIYQAVPERVDELSALLEQDQDGTNLRPVFMQWLQLHGWRCLILYQVQEALAEAGRHEQVLDSRVSNWDDAVDEFSNRTSNSSEAYSTILLVLREHFEKVERLGEDIFKVVNARLDNFFDLAQFDQAALLVLAVEIVERMDRNEAKERHRRAKCGEAVEKVEMLLPPHKHRKDALLRLEQAIGSRLETMLPMSLEPDKLNDAAADSDDTDSDGTDSEEQVGREKQVKYGPSKVALFCQASSACIVDLQVIAEDVAKCFPESYSILELYQTVFEHRILSLLRPVWQSDWASPADHLQVIGWIDQYVEVVHNLGSGLQDGASMRELRRECDAMMAGYVGQALPRIRGYMSAILERNNSPERSLDGYLQTAIPEDLFHALSQELYVVSSHGVHGHHMAMFVQNAILRVLEMYQQEQESRATDPSASAPIEWCVANMNDFERMYDLCDDALLVELQQSIGSSDPLAMAGVQDSLDVVSAGFIKGTAAGSQRIVDDIFNELEAQGISPALFTPEWASGEFRGADTICATFVDYFEDPDAGLRAWFASEMLFGRTVAACLQRTIQVYVMTLMKRVEPFEHGAKAAHTMRKDAQAFCTCFEQYLDAMRFAKIRSRQAFLEYVDIINAISLVLGDPDPQKSFERVATDFGAYAEQAIARLLFLRGDLSARERADLMLYESNNLFNLRDGKFDLSTCPPLPKESLEDDIEADTGKKKRKQKVKKKLKSAILTVKKTSSKMKKQLE